MGENNIFDLQNQINVLHSLLARIDERQSINHSYTSENLKKILEQTTKTNGRVNELEKINEKNKLNITDLNSQVLTLQESIQKINKKNEEQDIAIATKKGIWEKALEYIKWIALAYLVYKGIFGIDNLFGKF